MPEEKQQQEEPIARNPKNASLRGAMRQNNCGWESTDTPPWSAETEGWKLQIRRRIGGDIRLRKGRQAARNHGKAQWQKESKGEKKKPQKPVQEGWEKEWRQQRLKKWPMEMQHGVSKKYGEEGTKPGKGPQAGKKGIHPAWSLEKSQPSPRKTPGSHAPAHGNGSSAESEPENKHLWTCSLKAAWNLEYKQHFTICQEPAHAHLFAGLDLYCPNISTSLEVQIITGCSQGVCTHVQSHAHIHHNRPGDCQNSAGITCMTARSSNTWQPWWS